ncbi:MAG: tRNA (N(6)-L-threonylcarbamoyladenosine(37)-C(2))-methylthiotransferase MtaB [Lachnospiraceae bacterium]|nr:tRNA (N(6)-L-threonylcarbamoyladenosine(37)-C(2))-methylthiotransferase MtaB [Lachnospiraceae bacterium]
MPMKFAIHTLGCKVNTYESDLMVQQMKAAGFVQVPFEEAADVYLINTCTVTNIADRKSRQMLHRAKAKNPDALIVAAGCYANAVEQGKGLPEECVDLWVFNKEKSRIAELVKEKLCKLNKTSAAETDAWQKGLFLTELDGHTRAFVKIQDGCNQFCSYCIIPYVRGRITGRPVEDTLNEAKKLAARGVTEIVLTGIHLTSLGEDLLRTMEGLEQVEGIRRVRLGSLEPRLITTEFIETIGKFQKLCHHFHLSLQSGSDTVLKNMNRHYTAEEYAAGCDLIRKAWPDAAITTDIIVGFPRETEEEFEETLAFAKRVGFYEAHVFKYSRRKGTVADRMDGQLTEAVKTERSNRLMALCDEMSHAYRSRFLGKNVTFLYEETVTADGKDYLTGFTPEYVRCLLPVSAASAAAPASSKDASAPVSGALIAGEATGLVSVKNLGECLLLK